jgi:hypothetical protein
MPIKKEKAAAVLKKIEEEQKELRADLRKEFRKQSLTAITAALALVIALAWQEPIKLAVAALLQALGIPTDGIWPKLLAAVVITVIAALALVILSQWANRETK